MKQVNLGSWGEESDVRHCNLDVGAPTFRDADCYGAFPLADENARMTPYLSTSLP